MLAVGLGALALIETLRDGGFWSADALAITVVAALACLILWATGAVAARGSERLVIAGALALAAWWAIRAGTTGELGRFDPLGASLVGFAAAFAAVRALPAARRPHVVWAVGALGSVVALTGFAGLVARRFPLAIRSQGTVRLASTITYSDCAGLVLAVCLLVVLAAEVDEFPWLPRLAVFACSAGLLATQSRADVLAAVLAALLVPFRLVVRHALPLLCGLVLGTVAVATSPSHHAVPWLAGAGIGCAALAAWAPPLRWEARSGWSTTTRLGAVAGTLAVAALALVLVHHEIGLRALAPSDGDRWAEWQAAWHQFLSAPWLGVGPDRLLLVHAADGNAANFVHNEYLQVLAGGGVIGLGLLALTMVALVRSVRRHDPLAAGAVAGLVCLALVGAVDFDWHVPVVGLLAGAVAGLAVPLTDRPQTLHQVAQRVAQ
ncbi:MAG TPA: O-antigen ligase family protein [Acidimicrobiales bacterium]